MDKMSRRKMLSVSLGSALVPILGMAATKTNPGDALTGDRRKLVIVVMGAHPDDPESICGGTMCLLSDAGHEVVAAYLTKGERGIPETGLDAAAKIRAKEAQNACSVTGARPEFLGQIDGDTEINVKRYEEVRQFLEKVDPDIVFTHWPIDTHRDHRACSLLTYDAWLHMDRRFKLYYCEAMTGDQSQNFKPDQWVNIDSVIKRKHEACYAHKSQNVDEWYKDTHGKMEAFRGLECGSKYAEAFVEQSQGPKTSFV